MIWVGQMETDSHAMISIRSNHAANIVEGAKTVELRRRFMPLAHGSRLWIYATLPVGALVATATVCDIDYDEPQVLWARYKNEVAVSYSLFLHYFQGCELGFAIRLSNIEMIEPVPLERIRKIRGVDHIPQVATRISSVVAKQFERYGQAHLA